MLRDLAMSLLTKFLGIYRASDFRGGYRFDGFLETLRSLQSVAIEPKAKSFCFRTESRTFDEFEKLATFT